MSTKKTPKPAECSTPLGRIFHVAEEERLGARVTILYDEEFNAIASLPGHGHGRALLGAAYDWSELRFDHGLDAGRRLMASEVRRLLGCAEDKP